MIANCVLLYRIPELINVNFGEINTRILSYF